MGKTDKKANTYLYLIRSIDTPACIANRRGDLLERNDSFNKLIKTTGTKRALNHLESIISEPDIPRVLDLLSENESFSVSYIKGVVCSCADEHKCIYDIDLIPIEKEENFILVFKNALIKSVTNGISETSFRHTLLGMLATGISHDINNKLSVILGLAALASRKTSDEDELGKDLKGIQRAAFDAANLVQSLVKFSRAKDDEKSMVNLPVVLKEISKFARSVIPSTVNISVDLDPGCGDVETRIGALNSLFVLIISEAIQSLNRGGELFIELAGRKKTESDGERAICSFICRGEKYSDTHADFIGFRRNRLQTIKSLATSAGVTIELVTEEGEGAEGLKIIFARQRHPSMAGLVTNDSNSIDILPSEGEKILLVEDEPMLARLLKRALEKSGYKVTIAENGVEGFTRWESSGGDYDLILTDMTMPEMSGTELAEKILKKRSDAKIILCTGFSDKVDEGDAKKLGIKRYLEKPVGNRELLGAIRSCLDDG